MDKLASYYAQRAAEYERIYAKPERQADLAALRQRLRGLFAGRKVLELACGTGLWTQELLPISRSILALDGAPEMLAVNRAKLNSSKVSYQQADLFTWQPAESYDLVFAAFWLSHVPPALLPAHLKQVARAVGPGGRVVLVDEPAGGAQLSGPVEGEGQQTRALHDGSQYRIIKVYHDPHALADELRKHGIVSEIWAGEYFFYLNGVLE